MLHHLEYWLWAEKVKWKHAKLLSSEIDDRETTTIRKTEDFIH